MLTEIQTRPLTPVDQYSPSTTQRDTATEASAEMAMQWMWGRRSPDGAGQLSNRRLLVQSESSMIEPYTHR
jgi:hypothetical protein